MFQALSILILLVSFHSHAASKKVLQCKNGEVTIHFQDNGRYQPYDMTIRGSVLDALVRQEPDAFSERRNSAYRFFRAYDRYVQSGNWMADTKEFYGNNGRYEYMYTLTRDNGGMILKVFFNSSRAHEKANYYFHPGECR